MNQLLAQEKCVADDSEHTLPNDIRRETHDNTHFKLRRSRLGLESINPTRAGNVEVFPKSCESSLQRGVKVQDSFTRAMELDSSHKQGIIGHPVLGEREISDDPHAWQYIKPGFVSDNSSVNVNMPMTCNGARGDFVRHESSENNNYSGVVNKSKTPSNAFNNQTSPIPTFLQASTPTRFESSIIDGNNKTQPAICLANINVADFNDVMRNIVKEEIKSAMKDLRQNMIHGCADVVAHAKRSFVDFQVKIVNEFIQTQYCLQEVESILNQMLLQDMLIEENAQLEAEVAQLRHELDPLKLELNQLKQKFLYNN